MNISKDLEATFDTPFSDVMPHLGEAFPEQEIRSALESVKKKTERWRALPNEAAIWLVIGMALLRDRSIEMVASQMNILWGAAKTVSSAAIVKARNRLGFEPMRRLFLYTAEAWGSASLEEHLWRGLKVLGIDGTCIRIPDSLKNDREFGRPSGGPSNDAAGYPVVRAVALLALRTRLLLEVAFDGYAISEKALARQLWEKLPGNSLTILDKGFVDYGVFSEIITGGVDRHFLCRAKKNMSYRVVEILADGDELVEVKMSASQRRENPNLPTHLILRRTRYQIKGFQPQALISSLLDPGTFPGEEIAKMYHERWELEITYDEIKTHTLDREEALRSQDPDKIRQELWGLFVAYNLVRQHIVRFARQHDISPHRISYRNTLHIVREICCAAALGAGSIRNLMKSLDERIALMILPARRSERRYPRHVKIKMSNYPKNKGRYGNQSRSDLPAPDLK